MNKITDLTIVNGECDMLAMPPMWQQTTSGYGISCQVCRGTLLLFFLSPYSPVLKVYWRIGKITQPKANYTCEPRPLTSLIRLCMWESQVKLLLEMKPETRFGMIACKEE